jgi:hypothetical protein
MRGEKAHTSHSEDTPEKYIVKTHQRSESLACMELAGQFVKHLDGIGGATHAGEMVEVDIERGGPEHSQGLLDERAHDEGVTAVGEVAGNDLKRTIGGMDGASSDR